ncbi:MAG: SCO family protein [bacterium]
MYRKIFLVACLLLLWGGITTNGQTDVPDTRVGIDEHLDSIIPLNLTFTNEQNQPVQLKDIIKKPTLLILVYFDCPGICPQLLSGVSDAVEKIDMQLGKDYQIVTVSFNYDDTPAKAVERKVNFLGPHTKPFAPEWHYLTGDSANIYALTNAVGYKFVRAGNDFIHPSCIMVLSPEGKITRYLYGVTYLPFDVKMALLESQKGLSRPTINRVYEYCFSYDPEGRRYTLEVTKISATIIIFLAVILFLILLLRSNKKRKQNQKSV